MNRFFSQLKETVGTFTLTVALVLVSACMMPVAAQESATNISGTVYDPDGNPLAGATVSIVNTTIGTITDGNGQFTISARPSDKLEVSYLGYTTMTMNVGTRTKFTVNMEADASTNINEVVVIGYGQTTRQDLTGSVASVAMKDIEGVPVLSVDNALQGRIAGADILSTTGEPGSTTSIRIEVPVRLMHLTNLL